MRLVDQRRSEEGTKMRTRVVVYVTGDELAELKRESKRRHISLSRYTKERLTLAPDTEVASAATAVENRLVEVVMKAASEREALLADNLRTVMVMIDNLALSTFTLAADGDAPEAEKRHRGWQREVEATLWEMRAEVRNGNGAHGEGA
jgi:hypothetical protein